MGYRKSILEKAQESFKRSEKEKRKAKRSKRKSKTTESRAKDGKEVTREFDRTQLKMAQFKHQPHKDYLGHIFRWGFAGKYINRKTRVLDVGCGQEMPFARSLGGANPNTVPELYVGVDLNKIKEPLTRKNFEVKDEFNIINNWKALRKQYGKFDVIVNFEVFEHMQMKHGRKMLRAFKKLLADDGILIFSIPVYSDRYKMAKNHINELRKSEIEDELQSAGFNIAKQFGTFGNWNDLKKVATKDEIALYKTVGEFYSNDLLGCFLSPKYPEAARNITHVCCHKDNENFESPELKKSIIQ